MAVWVFLIMLILGIIGRVIFSNNYKTSNLRMGFSMLIVESAAALLITFVVLGIAHFITCLH